MRTLDNIAMMIALPLYLVLRVFGLMIVGEPKIVPEVCDLSPKGGE